jgi:capsular exopolysaccharide synthesis family protein
MESTEFSMGFQQYWLILKRRWLPASAVFGSVFALTVLSLLLQKPVYVAEGKLLFKKTDTTSSLTGLGKEIGQLDPLQQENTPLDTEAENIRSVPIIQKTITKLDIKDNSGSPLKIKQFLEQLNVSDIRGTDVLQVSYEDRDPEKAAAVVNTLIAVYLENNLLANRAEAVAAREFIEKQLPTIEASVRQSELALRRFKEENKVVSLEEEAKSAVAIIEDLQRQSSSTQTQLADAKEQSAVLRNELGRDLQKAGAVTSTSQSPAVQELLKEVQQVESQLAIERSRFREDHPTITSLKSKKADLERLLPERVKRVLGNKRQQTDGNLQISQFEQNLTEEFAKSEARRLGLASQAAALSNLQATYRQRVNILPRLEQKQRELERQLEASQSTYALLLQKLQESRIAENQNVGNVRVTSFALIPDEPVAPRKSLYLVAGVLLSSLLSVVTALVLETRDKSIRTVDEARNLFGFTPLGVIPYFKRSEKTTLRDGDSEQSTPEIVVRDALRSPFSAAYRMLQVNLKFLSSDKQLKAIVVTSSVPKEGKSTVSANLAASMAQLGRKVLLVDADMHRPVQHQIWDLPNQLGLSNLLVGQAELRTVIKEVMVNLDVLTSGVMPPNPMALIDSQRMASLIEMFSANYDFTIIDTAPLSVEAEAPILGKMADGVLLVVRPGVVDSANAALAKALLEQSGQNVLGQVMNGVIPENEPYSYYYFSKQYYVEESATKSKKSSERQGSKNI